MDLPATPPAPPGGIPKPDFSQLKFQGLQAGQVMSEQDFQRLIAVSKMQSEGKVQFMKRLMEACYDKCSARKFKEPDLLLGESVCIDRCVSKYEQVKKLVSESSLGPVPWEITEGDISEISRRTTVLPQQGGDTTGAPN